MSSRTDFHAMNASGIVLASMANKHDLNADLGNTGKSDIDMNAGTSTISFSIIFMLGFLHCFNEATVKDYLL